MTLATKTEIQEPPRGFQRASQGRGLLFWETVIGQACCPYCGHRQGAHLVNRDAEHGETLSCTSCPREWIPGAGQVCLTVG